MKISFVLIPILMFVIGCNVEKQPFHEGKILAGKEVSAKTLNLGYTTYVEYCIQCHGMDGKGQGPSSKGLLPPPRNLTQGLYKFPWVSYGELPHDEDFARIIRGGLNGSAMLKWDISDERLDAVIQYIKTFAPQTWEGKDKTLGTKLDLPKDPYGEVYKNIAVEKGRKVYHVVAACTQCHRAYATRAEVQEWAKELKADVDTTAADYFQLKAQDGEYNYKILPPDFTYHSLRSITDVPSIVQRLMYGVTGSGMPGWKDVVTDEQLWELAYYVEHLQITGKDLKARNDLMDKIKE
jgi:mono/diheme cytochrome c family protein